MSNQALNWARKQRTGSPIRKAVLMALADQANSDGECYPGQKSMSHDLEMGERTARKAVTELHDLGIITVEHRKWDDSKRQRTNVYRLHVAPDDTPAAGDAGGPAAPGASQPAAGDAAKEPQDSEPSTKEPKTYAPPKSQRAPNPLFESVAEVCGLDWRNGLTKAARGSLANAVADLKRVGASPEEVRRRGENWRTLFDRATLTPPALAKHWPQLAHVQPRAGPRDRYAEMAESLLGREEEPGEPTHRATGTSDAPRRGLPAGPRH